MKKNELKSKYPKNFPIPPNRIDQNKLDLILERELQQWKVVTSPLPEDPYITREELFREYSFKNFSDVLKFMNEVAVKCNIIPHHPRWENTWSSLKVYLTTWDNTHIISYKDIILARHFDEAFKKYEPDKINTQQLLTISTEKENFFKKIESDISSGEIEEAIYRLEQFVNQPIEDFEKEPIIEIIEDYADLSKEHRHNNLSLEQISKRYDQLKENILKVVNNQINKAKVYFSYAWGGEKEEIVSKLYLTLEKDKNLELIRDKTNLEYKGLISDFIKKIGRGNIVIIALSPKYLRSEYCMFELYELYRNSFLDNKTLINKIFPIIVEPINLNTPKEISELFEYWVEKENEWSDLVSSYNYNQETLNKIISIRGSLRKLIPLIRDINTSNLELISKSNFKIIKQAIYDKIQ